MADIQEIAQVASRAYEDTDFAREVLEGKHDYPEVRDAILRDLASAPGADGPGTGAPADDLQERLRSSLRTGDMNVARLAERARSW